MQERERIPEPVARQEVSAPAKVVVGRRARRGYEGIRRFIAEQDWLEPVANTAQGVVGRAMEAVGPSVTDFFHGTWLRHPLHVALSDVPVGAWTVAVAMDALDLGRDRPQYAAGADAAVAMGVAAAVPTALSGMADWRHVDGYPRRVGLLHAMLNSVGLLFQVASLAMRLRGRRRQGVACSALGVLATVGAAWLGGELVEEQGIGVDHTAFRAGPGRFVPVMNEAGLPEGRLHRAQAAGVNVLLFRRDGRIYAIADTCAHQGCSLSEGRLEDTTVICPCHGSQYRLEDGTLVHGPSTFDQPRYEVRIVDGRIEVRRAPMAGE